MQLHELGPLVRERRRSLNITQETLADLAGCSKPFVIAVESGKTSLRLDKLWTLLKVLGLEVNVTDRNGAA